MFLVRFQNLYICSLGQAHRQPLHSLLQILHIYAESAEDCQSPHCAEVRPVAKPLCNQDECTLQL